MNFIYKQMYKWMVKNGFAIKIKAAENGLIKIRHNIHHNSYLLATIREC